jgi:hypothetical protein
VRINDALTAQVNVLRSAYKLAINNSPISKTLIPLPFKSFLLPVALNVATLPYRFTHTPPIYHLGVLGDTTMFIPFKVQTPNQHFSLFELHIPLWWPKNIISPLVCEPSHTLNNKHPMLQGGRLAYVRSTRLYLPHPSSFSGQPWSSLLTPKYLYNSLNAMVIATPDSPFSKAIRLTHKQKVVLSHLRTYLSLYTKTLGVVGAPFTGVFIGVYPTLGLFDNYRTECIVHKLHNKPHAFNFKIRGETFRFVTLGSLPTHDTGKHRVFLRPHEHKVVHFETNH